jgi:hypothetical protein
MAQQCQPSTSVTGQLAAGEGATVDMAKSGPAVMAAAGGRKQQSNHLQAHVPSWSSEGTLSHVVKTTRPCSIPRTTRARTTAAPRTTRPVVLTSRQGRRHLWQAKRATLHLHHDDRVKKGSATSFKFVSFSPSPFSLLLQGPGKAIPRKGSFSVNEAGPEVSYSSEVRRLASRKGSIAALEHSGSAPTTNQRFEGWPLGRVWQPPQSTRAPRPLLIMGSKAGPPKGSTAASEHTERGMTMGTSDTWPRLGLRSRGTLGHFQDQQERFCNGIPSEGGIEPSDPIKRGRVRQITYRYFWSAPLGH